MYTLKDLKPHIGPNTAEVGDLISLYQQLIGHPDKKKINKEVPELNDTIGLMELMMCREYSILQ
jgi:hypothetical protein